MHEGVLAVLIVIGLVLLALGVMLALRCWRNARRILLPGLGLLLWYLAAHALRYVPDRVLEILLYEVDTSLSELLTGSAYAPVQQGFNAEAVFPGAVGISLACVAATLTWQSARRK